MNDRSDLESDDNRRIGPWEDAENHGAGFVRIRCFRVGYDREVYAARQDWAGLFFVANPIARDWEQVADEQAVGTRLAELYPFGGYPPGRKAIAAELVPGDVVASPFGAFFRVKSTNVQDDGRIAIDLTHAGVWNASPNDLVYLCERANRGKST